MQEIALYCDRENNKIAILWENQNQKERSDRRIGRELANS